MDQDAVDVRPLRQITGEAEFNEIFIEDAGVPDENVVGGVGNGWMVGITTLMHERAGLGAASAVALRRELDELIALIRERGLGDDPVIRDRVARLQISAEALRLGGLRTLTQTMRTGIPGPEGSLAKWQWADANQELTELATEVLGPGGPGAQRVELPFPARARQLDRGRDHRGDEEHHRRACARPPEAEVVAGMDFGFNDEQQEIKRTAHEFLVRAVSRPRRSASWRSRAPTTTPCGARSASSAGPGSRSTRSTAARGWEWSSW